MSDYDRLEFRHLKFILAVAETQSFTGAAELVHTSQSNVSTQIGDLEDLLGVELFHREREGVLTPPGSSSIGVRRRSRQSKLPLLWASQFRRISATRTRRNNHTAVALA
jgi:hypothetical protein